MKQSSFVIILWDSIWVHACCDLSHDDVCFCAHLHTFAVKHLSKSLIMRSVPWNETNSLELFEYNTCFALPFHPCIPSICFACVRVPDAMFLVVGVDSVQCSQCSAVHANFHPDQRKWIQRGHKHNATQNKKPPQKTNNKRKYMPRPVPVYATYPS
jgi:hypothetical protein